MMKVGITQNNHPLKTFFVFALLIVLASAQAVTNKKFCHSSCISYIGACFDTSANSCYVCADSIYKAKDFTNPSNPCVLKDQRKLLFNALDSGNSLSLDGFSASNPALFTCNSFPFSGRYANTDYIAKNFTGINTEHFELVIRFNVGYFGSWGTSDNLQLQVHDGVSSSFHSWSYNCGQYAYGSTGLDDTKNLCSTQGTDCIKIKEFTIQHNSSFVFLKWTSLTSQNNPNIQSWGIKDILITAKTCHRYCDRCFGETVSQCLTCSPGYFLRGNTCIQKCPKLSIPTTQQCVDSCPNKYFHNPLNNFCEPCMDGCSFCSGQSQCLLWTNQEASPAGSLWYDKIELWIIMIVGGVALISLIMWKFVVKKFFLKGEEVSTGSDDSKEDQLKSLRSSNSGEIKQMKNTETNLTNQLWIVDAQNLDPVKLDVRRRKKRKADIDQSMNNSQIQL